jgi:hypothetical protein
VVKGTGGDIDGRSEVGVRAMRALLIVMVMAGAARGAEATASYVGQVVDGAGKGLGEAKVEMSIMDADGNFSGSCRRGRRSSR